MTPTPAPRKSRVGIEVARLRAHVTGVVEQPNREVVVEADRVLCAQAEIGVPEPLLPVEPVRAPGKYPLGVIVVSS